MQMLFPYLQLSPPKFPKTVENAFIVNAEPVIISPALSTEPKTPEDAIASPVIVHITIVSKKVPVMLI